MSDPASLRRVVPVILSGGAGTRLWPLSTPGCPKQFIPLAGSETMLQLTARRVADPGRFDPPIIVASAAHAELVEAQLGECGVSALRLILEPNARNTAPAIALAALAAPAADALLMVMPSDHLIKAPERLREAVGAAAPLAAEGWLIAFGVQPSRPETAYGYIKRGGELAAGVFRGEAFVEKPDLDTARSYVSEGCYDWNAGIFLFRADVYLEALASHAPEILAAAKAAMEGVDRSGARIAPDAARFSGAPSESIDYAVMEKAERFAVAPVDMEWSDVGSWDALHDVSRQDESGNALAGDVLALGAKGCLLRSEGPKLVAIGVEDLIVIATGDAVLVVPRSQSQRVKEAVEALRAQSGA